MNQEKNSNQMVMKIKHLQFCGVQAKEVLLKKFIAKIAIIKEKKRQFQ